MKSILNLIGTTFLFLAIPLPLHAQSVSYRTVALSGSRPPGTDLGFSYNLFSDPSINNRGQVVFNARTGPNSDRGIWSDDTSGVLRLVALRGQQLQAPFSDLNHTGFVDFPPSPMNDFGQIAVIGSISGPGVTADNNTTVWIGGTDTPLQFVAREGFSAPGTPVGVNFSELFSELHVSDSGQVAFEAKLKGTGVTTSNDDGLWAGTKDNVRLIARDGIQVALPGGGFRIFSGIRAPIIDSSGRVSFNGTALEVTSVAFPRQGVWTEKIGGGLENLAYEGQQAPGTATGVTFKDISWDMQTNASGKIAFRSTLAGTGVDTSNDVGVWIHDRMGNFNLVVRQGQPAPGLPQNTVFSGISNVTLSDSENMMVNTELAGPGITSNNNTAIWLKQGGSDFELVVRKGDHAPGTNSGIVFGESTSGTSFYAPVLNNQGQVAFVSYLSGPGVVPANSRGIWATDLDGAIWLVAREGDLFDTDPSAAEDLRTIQSLTFDLGWEGDEGGDARFNDLGQVVFEAVFTDGSSGIFVATIPVPEPGTILFFILGGVGLFWRARRRSKSC